MKISAEKQAEIAEKHQKLNKARHVLSSEFVGIDSVIDEFLSAFEQWYYFPECQTRPVVINLWGLTGTGKTSLIKRTVELLGMSDLYVHLDSGEFARHSDHSLKRFFNVDLNAFSGQSVLLCFDEIQHARTIDDNRHEDESASLRSLWELLDTGILTTFDDISMNLTRISVRTKALRDSLRKGAKLSKGRIVEQKESVVSAYDRYVNNFYSNFNNLRAEKEEISLDDLLDWDDLLETLKPKFKDINSIQEYVADFDLPELINFLESINNCPVKQVQLDLSKSIIFIVGNLDEAYNFNCDVDPDKDPDIFRRLSEDISVTTIKQALRNRFRSEQISRLGNTHIIYPAFSSADYRELIRRELEKSAQRFAKNMHIKLSFTKALEDIIYSESVYPTQGARPVIVSVGLLVESYFGRIANDLFSRGTDAVELIWDFADGQFNIRVADSDGNESRLVYKPTLKLETARERFSDNSRALIAVHESGHAIVASVVTGIAPLKITCNSSDSNSGGSTLLNLPDDPIETLSLIKARIMTSFGGIIAEELVFGPENVSTGAQYDVAQATEMAVSLVKDYAMGSVAGYFSVPSEGRNDCLSAGETQEAEARNLLAECHAKAKMILLENDKLLRELARRLATKRQLYKQDIEEIVLRHTADKSLRVNGFTEKNHFFRFHEMLFGYDTNF